VWQCDRAGTAVYVKQLEIGGRVETDPTRFPPELQRRELPWELAKKGRAK
jgi:hypothetical protein